MLPFVPDIELAARLFDELRKHTADGPGVTRMSYGAGEDLAHEIVRREAEALGLTVETDPACNLYMTLPGVDDARRIVIGSHLDSVPMGGNFDGAAGVLMGLCVVSALARAGHAPPTAITAMAIRAEESAWFSASYIGSRAAFGRLPATELDTVTRAGDGTALRDAIAASGGDPDAIAKGHRHWNPDDIALYLEPHIEQGPVLAAQGIPLGIVTDLRGSRRYRHAACTGTYAHSGATPRDQRRDAVLAVSCLVTRLDTLWQDMAADGHDLTVTVGEFSTAAAESSFSKVAGLVRFSLDMRSNSVETLTLAAAQTKEITAAIAAERGVEFDLGDASTTTPAPMHPDVIDGLDAAARGLNLPAMRMPCGAGHDAATFASLGVPTGMLFIRNQHGSHDPHEHMEMVDFAGAAEVLMQTCLNPPAIAR